MRERARAEQEDGPRRRRQIKRRRRRAQVATRARAQSGMCGDVPSCGYIAHVSRDLHGTRRISGV